MSYQDGLLAEHEHVKRRAHRHVLFVTFQTLPLALLGVSLWVLAFLSYRYNPYFPGIVALILVAISLIPLGISAYRFLWWRAEEYLVTNLRIIQVEGIMSKRTLDSSLGRINDVEMKQPMFGRMFNFGDINILTGSDQSINDLHGISQPMEFKKALLQAKAEFDGVWPSTQPGRASVGAPAAVAASREDSQPNRRQETTSNGFDDTAKLDNTSRILTALTELRNAGVLSEAEYQDKLRRLMSG